MAWGINQIELIALTIVCVIHDANGIRFDGDTALTFNIHSIQQLRVHIAFFNGMGKLQDAIADG